MENQIVQRRVVVLEKVISCLPFGIRREILRIGASRKGFPIGLSEIRLRSRGVCALIFVSERIPLITSVSEAELSAVLERITDGSLYSYKDMLAQGFVPIDGGVRVGICARARYDDGVLAGIHGISSMVFRLPFGDCDFAAELCELFLSKARSGMLIYAPPGGGKTTALRSLVRLLSSGEGAKRVVVVDERCEFIPEEYLRCEADVLRGYKRADGIEIASRTLNPEIIVIDEIGAKELEGLLSVIRCGIPIIATAHAASVDELLLKPAIRALVRQGAFDVFVGIVKNGAEYGFNTTLIDEARGRE